MNQINSGNCILFVTNEDYVFALGVILMSLQQNSPYAYTNSDIVILHDGITEISMRALHKICSKIRFINVSSKNLISPHMCLLKELGPWGKYILFKLYGFELILQYEKVLLLDVDMFIFKEINNIFSITQDIAFIPASTSNPPMIKSLIGRIDKKNDIPICWGGLILFNESIINKLQLNSDMIEHAINIVKNIKCNSLEEKLISYFTYAYELEFAPLSTSICAPPFAYQPSVKILHFVGDKPWNSFYLYASFPQWGYYYKKWLALESNFINIYPVQSYMLKSSRQHELLCAYKAFPFANDLLFKTIVTGITIQYSSRIKLMCNVKDFSEISIEILYMKINHEYIINIILSQSFINYDILRYLHTALARTSCKYKINPVDTSQNVLTYLVPLETLVKSLITIYNSIKCYFELEYI